MFTYGFYSPFIAIVGDITPSDGVPKHEKSRMEQEALDEMCKVLGGGMRGLTQLRGYIYSFTIHALTVSIVIPITFIWQPKKYKNYGRSMKTTHL